MLQTIVNLPAVGTTQGSVSVRNLVANWGIQKRVVVGLMQKYGLTTNQVEAVFHITFEYESVRSIIAGLMKIHQDQATVEGILEINRQIGMPIKDVSKLAEKFDVAELRCIAEFIDDEFGGDDDWQSRHKFCKIITLIAKSEEMVFPDAILDEAKIRLYGRGDVDDLIEEEE